MASQPYPVPQRPYVATTITLALASTVYRLYDLVNAIKPNTPMSAREVNVQLPSGADQASQAGAVWGGDATVSETVYGWKLSPVDGLSNRWRSNQGNMIWGEMHVITDTPGTILAVEVIGC